MTINVKTETEERTFSSEYYAQFHFFIRIWIALLLISTVVIAYAFIAPTIPEQQTIREPVIENGNFTIQEKRVTVEGLTRSIYEISHFAVYMVAFISLTIYSVYLFHKHAKESQSQFLIDLSVSSLLQYAFPAYWTRNRYKEFVNIWINNTYVGKFDLPTFLEFRDFVRDNGGEIEEK